MASESSACHAEYFAESTVANAALNNYFQQQMSTNSGEANENGGQMADPTSGNTSSGSSQNCRVHSTGSASSGSGNHWSEQQHPQPAPPPQHIQQRPSSQLHSHSHNHHHQQPQPPQSLHGGHHSHPQHPHLSHHPAAAAASQLPPSSNTHSIFGTGNYHYKTNNSWTIPSLSYYQRICGEPPYGRNLHHIEANSHGTPGGGGGAGAGAGGGNGGSSENLISHLHGSGKRFLINSGKSGNNKDICGDDKFKEDGDPWNVEAQAAFLGPNLWDKTLPYDADLKVTQYADLDEFLSENNIPDGLPGTHLGHSTGLGHRSDSLGHSAGLSLSLGHVTTKRERSPSPSDCISPDTLNPPSPAESTFSFASSGRDFDPRTRAFSDEELKPQPMIKKSRKQFVPDELKDDKYWARRRKNNIAAKRSRDARRQKENQIAMRARYLEKENATLHQEVEQLKQENMDLRSRLSKYQDV